MCYVGRWGFLSSSAVHWVSKIRQGKGFGYEKSVAFFFFVIKPRCNKWERLDIMFAFISFFLITSGSAIQRVRHHLIIAWDCLYLGWRIDFRDADDKVSFCILDWIFSIVHWGKVMLQLGHTLGGLSPKSLLITGHLFFITSLWLCVVGDKKK